LILIVSWESQSVIITPVEVPKLKTARKLHHTHNCHDPLNSNTDPQLETCTTLRTVGVDVGIWNHSFTPVREKGTCDDPAAEAAFSMFPIALRTQRRPLTNNPNLRWDPFRRKATLP